MKPSSLLRPCLVALALAAANAATIPDAQAQVAVSGPRLACQVSGHTVVKANTMIYDRATGGRAIAKLTGAKVPLTITEFPASPTGRVKLQTSTGKGSLRVEGYVGMNDLRFFAARDVAMKGTSIWLSQGQLLDVTKVARQGLTVEHTILGSENQKLTGTLPCDAVQITYPSFGAIETPARARTYQMRNDSIELFDGPRGDLLLELRMRDGARKVFWSTEARYGYVHVLSKGDITIDAWVKASDLAYLHHAELFDLESLRPPPLKEQTLAVADPPALVTATSDIPIHAKPENGTPIGKVEAGTKLYPMEQAGDWTNVMPEGLAVLPADDVGFWVRTASLPGKD